MQSEKGQYKLCCKRCGVLFDETLQTSVFFKCKKCGDSLIVENIWKHKNDYLAKILKKPPTSIWSYKVFLPLRDEEPITIGEGCTPLLNCGNVSKIENIKKLYVKNEGTNPTGTYKDRGVAVSITKANGQKIDGVILGSAGNAGAAACAYAAKSRIPCFLILPIAASKSRENMANMFGANIIRIKGSIDDAIRLSEKVQKHFRLVNVSTAGVFNPYGVEGYKTIGYELAFQFNFNLPDMVIVPVGGGSLLTKIWEGLGDVKRLGLINKLPKMIGVQASGCAPLVKAYKTGSQIVKWGKPKTLAFSIADEWPHDGELAIKAICESGGILEEVDDISILKAQKMLGEKEAILAEASSATTLACLTKLRATGYIDKTSSVVLIISGTGVKDISEIVKKDKSVPIIKNDESRVISLISKALDNISK